MQIPFLLLSSPVSLTSLLFVTHVCQTGTILVPDFVTTILNLMTGMGLLGVAAVVSKQLPLLHPPTLLICVEMQVVGVMIESVLPVFQKRFGYGCDRHVASRCVCWAFVLLR